MFDSIFYCPISDSFTFDEKCYFFTGSGEVWEDIIPWDDLP